MGNALSAHRAVSSNFLAALTIPGQIPVASIGEFSLTLLLRLICPVRKMANRLVSL